MKSMITTVNDMERVAISDWKESQLFKGNYALTQLVSSNNPSAVYAAELLDNKKRMALKQIKLPMEEHSRNALINQLNLRFMALIPEDPEETKKRVLNVQCNQEPGDPLVEEDPERVARRAIAAGGMRRFHENIVKHYGVEVVEGTRLEEPQFLIRMEYLTGSTLQTIANGRPLTEMELANVGRQILRGLSFLYQQQYVHRNLDDTHIVITGDQANLTSGISNVKIIGFGTAKQLLDKQTNVHDISFSQRSASLYRSPEMVQKYFESDVEVGRSTDIWSFGVLLLSAACRGEVQRLRDFSDLAKAPVPLKGVTDMTLMDLILPVRNDVTNGLSPDYTVLANTDMGNLKTFISKCLVRDKNQRPTADALLSDPFIGVSETMPHYTTSMPLQTSIVMENEVGDVHDGAPRPAKFTGKEACEAHEMQGLLGTEPQESDRVYQISPCILQVRTLITKEFQSETALLSAVVRSGLSFEPLQFQFLIMIRNYAFTEGPHTYTYSIVREIGRGGFGTVSEATELKNGASTNRRIAVKETLHKEPETGSILGSVSEKLRNIRLIKSRNVTVYHQAKLEQLTTDMQPFIRTVIVMEYCELGSLESYIKANPNLPDDQIKDLIQQILNGLMDIHNHKVIHTDLKTANIVLTSDSGALYGITAKITDVDDHFALMATITKTNEAAGICRGTVMFMSPEMITGGTNGYAIGKKTDIWSMGCIIVELYRKQAPFRFFKIIDGRSNPADMLLVDRAHPETIKTFVAEGGVPEIPWELADVVRTTIENCFQKDPRKRPSARDLLHGALFQNENSLREAGEPDTRQATTANVEFTLRCGESIPRPNYEMKWDCGVNCAARVLVHHTPHTHFPYHLYATEVVQVKKNIDPGQPLDEKYRRMLLKWLQQGQATAQQNPLAALVSSVGTFLLAAPAAPRMSSLLTLFLPIIGPSYPEVAAWMNKYTHEYEYVCEGRATWPTIKKQLDRREPVIAQVCLGDVEISEMVRQAAYACGCQDFYPRTFPNIYSVILRGYEGVAPNGDPLMLTYTLPDGETGFRSYEEFKSRANWVSSHPLVKEAFDESGYEPGQIIYRKKKNASEDYE
ncbi:uncharacterized protein LOC129594851 [Paramacrobiotus metropolitanus]|uniref:uncharacterized protein LOC129594851 n=1 Tax=Paramacrobiotus metropolitanus TaxID=2943436 RepID=UPI00244615E5|nr:uncharacterized protein LOC129594851 [Paramacrobiotus metropolitanus]